MNCKERTSLKLSSNIISEKSGRGCVGVYVPTDLKPNEFELIRIKDILAGVVYPVED
jgi:hypothetical protein